jgi:hypothetical protein
LVVHRFTIARVFHGIGEGDPLGANPPSGRRFDRLEVDDADAVGPFPKMDPMAWTRPSGCPARASADGAQLPRAAHGVDGPEKLSVNAAC